MNFKFSIFMALFLFILLPSLDAQQTPFSKGVNLTGWFQTNSVQQVQFNRYQLKDFQQIKSLGCDVVRLPVNLFGMTDGAPLYNIDPLFYTFMDSVISWAEQTEMHLILDNHSFEPNVISGKDNGAFLLQVWPQIASRYKESYQNLYFELLNEPHDITDAKWNSIQQNVINKIRQTDNTHFLIVGPAGWNSYYNLAAMPNYTDPKLIFTFHFYDPFLFTHQGASWVEPSMVPLSGVPFPYSAGQMPSMPSTFIGSWLQSAYNSYSIDGRESKVRELIDIAVQFKNQRNVPIYCGEFGVLMNNAADDDRTYWYEIVRKHLEQNGVSWTTWDYHGGFGLFEKGGNGLFDHDLNVGLIEALGLNVPDQTEFNSTPDSSGFIVYDDFIGPGIAQSSSTSGTLSIYSANEPKSGNYSISWKNPQQYDLVGFDFSPNRDLSVLVNNNYKLDLWIKGNRAGAKLDIRFLDTKTGIGGDRPWRIRYVVDASKVNWDGNWHKLSIPLKDFTEQGSWDDNTWYNPIGAFDWSAIDRLEIVDEYGVVNPVSFGFDQIEITGPPLKNNTISPESDISIWPNPAVDIIYVKNESSHLTNFKLFDLNGTVIQDASLKEENKIDISSLLPGIYFIRFQKNAKSYRTYSFLKTVSH